MLSILCWPKVMLLISWHCNSFVLKDQFFKSTVFTATITYVLIHINKSFYHMVFLPTNACLNESPKFSDVFFYSDSSALHHHIFKYYCYTIIEFSDRPKFGSVPVPAEIGIGTEIPVSVPAISEILVPAEISVQM